MAKAGEVLKVTFNHPRFQLEALFDAVLMLEAVRFPNASAESKRVDLIRRLRVASSLEKPNKNLDREYYSGLVQGTPTKKVG